MKYIVNAEEMRRADKNTSEVFGVKPDVLMERAALEVVDAILRDHEATRGPGASAPRVLVFACGGGNGGDGIAVSRLFHQRGSQTLLVAVGEISRYGEAAKAQLDTAMKYAVPMIRFKEPEEAEAVRMVTERRFDYIVDAMFGTGLSRPLSGVYSAAVALIHRIKATDGDRIRCVSIDMPSGIDSDTAEVRGMAVKADITVTMNHKKRGLVLYPGALFAGRIEVADAGITEESFLDRTPELVYFDEAPALLLPSRKASFNKGDLGKLLIIAGNGSIGGAAVLAARGAMAAGVGMVRVFTEKKNRTALLQAVPEALIDVWDDEETVSETAGRLRDSFAWADACVAGPGLGTDERAAEIIKTVLKNFDGPLVIDADGVNLISKSDELRRLTADYECAEGGGPWPVLTPHVGEFSRLSGRDRADIKGDLIDAPLNEAERLGCTVLLKDARSVTAQAGRRERIVNLTGNSGMATAGSGDVLAGLVGALSALGLPACDAAAAGAYIHGLGGDAAAKKRGEAAMTAVDIVRGIREVLR